MSTGDFQTKYASVMESMLKGAIAETTKLFENMVDELKAEMSTMRKENEDLKTRCSQYESEKSQSTVGGGETERLRGCSERRDTAVQCDLVPFCTKLVEQCQPLGYSSLQNQHQQHRHEERDYSLQEHNYGVINSQTAFMFVKDKETYVDSVLQQEEVKPSVVCGNVSIRGETLTEATACGTESEGLLINHISSTGEMSEKDEETSVTLELTCLEMNSDLQRAQKKSSEPEHLQVITIIDDTKEKTEGQLVTSEEQPLVTALEQSIIVLQKEQLSVIHPQCPREGDISISEQTDVVQQYVDVYCPEEQLAKPTTQNKKAACEDQKNGTAEGGAKSLPVRRRQGRVPKKLKHLQQQVKEILKSSSTDSTTGQDLLNFSSGGVEKVEISSVVDKVNTPASGSQQVFPFKLKKTPSFILPSVRERLVESDLGDVENCKVGSLTRGCSSEKKKTSGCQQLSIKIEAPSAVVSSVTETAKSLPAELPQAQLVQFRERSSSVTLQDAMLLVEAMNLSTEENMLSSLKRMAASPQIQCASHMGTLQTTDKVPTASRTLSTEAFEAVGSPPMTELAKTQLAVQKLIARPQVTDSTPTNIIIPKRPVVTPSNIGILPKPSSTAATQTSVQSQKTFPRPVITLVKPSKHDNDMPNKIIVVPRPAPLPHNNATLSPTQLPKCMPTVVMPQNNLLFPASTTASLPLRTPSVSSFPQKTTYVTSQKSLPIVPSHSIATATSRKSVCLPPRKITIIIPRRVSTVASGTQTVVTTKDESTKPAAALTVSSSQLISSSQEMAVSVDSLTAEVATISSQVRDNITSNVVSPKQTASVSEITNLPPETCSSLKRLHPTSAPTSVSPAEQKLSAVVRLTRLPISVSTKESVLVSRLLSNGCPECQSILKKGATQDGSSVVQPAQSLVRPAVSTIICPSLKETSVSVFGTSQMSEEKNTVQEKLSSETCTTLGESFISGYVQPSTPKILDSDFVSQTISMTKLSAGEPASNLEEEIFSNTMQYCALSNDQPTEEKGSVAPIQLTPALSTDTSDLHLQMSKTQFLAQLAVSPVAQAPQQASSNDFGASSAEISTNGKKKLQKNSLLTRLRRHLKTQLQTSAGCVDGPNVKNTASETIPISPKKSGVVEDVTSLNKTANDSIPKSPRRTGLCREALRSKMSVCEPTRRSKATPKSSKRSNLGRDSVVSKTIRCVSVCPRRSSSTKDGASSTKDGASSKKTKSVASHKNTKLTSVGSSRIILTRDGPCSKETKSTIVSPERSSSTRDGARLKKKESSVAGSGKSKLRENDKSFERSPSKSISVNCTSAILTQDGPSARQLNRESSSFSPRGRTSSSAIDKTQNETGSLSVNWPKLPKDDVRSRKLAESTPVKKPRIIEDATCLNQNSRGLNAKNLAKASTMAKNRQLAENQTSREARKKYTTEAVWIPPTRSAVGDPLSLLPVKKDTKSPRATFHHSVPLNPIPFKGPPIVSPLQPLSVIGRCLLKNQCGECGRILSSSAALESHVSLHNGRRPFSCTLCAKSFPDAKGLERHGRVHRNGRIYICKECGKGFTYRFGLTKHLQMVHSRIKPFVCQICNKGFYTKRDVEAHIRIHTGEKPFQCSLCEKKFARRVELNVHLRWHNGEKRHWCSYCGKGFLDFNNLKRHRYIHTGEKPHSCPHCPKHFTQSGHLKKHVKNVHKIH